MTAGTTTATRCRYLQDNGQQCHQQALQTSHIDICPHHASLILTAIRQQAASRTKERT